MDIFLNFKNKNYEAQFFDSVDPYLSKIVKSSLIFLVVIVPFYAYTQYLLFQNPTVDLATNIRRCILGFSIYIILGFAVLFIYKKKALLRKHQQATRWSFDVFLLLISGYYAYQYYDFNKDGVDPLTQYMLGWWQCLLAVTLFSPISRWYLKLASFVAIIVRIGVGTYITTESELALIKMFQMVILEVLLTYYHEKDRRRYFIEKQALHEETKVYKEIFDLTSDGVIIYSLKDGMIFRNWANDKYRWWQGEDCRQNFERIVLKGYKQLAPFPANMDLDLSLLFQSSNQANFMELLEHLTQQLNANMSAMHNSYSKAVKTKSCTQTLYPGSLMLLTGSVEQQQQQVSFSPKNSNNQTTASSLLEIKIMFTCFREKPSLALVFSDITERNLVAVLQETNNYKNRLLASVSHELRTPLNASINFTQAALEHPDLSNLTEIKENLLMPSLRSSQLLLHLINDILDFSQMSANKLRLVFENKNIHATLDECVNLIKIQASRKGLFLKTDYKFENEDNEMFCTDHNRLKQIVLNLLSNALKFTLEGEIRISASVEFSNNLGSSSQSEIITVGRPTGTTEDRLRKVLERKKQRILKVSVSDTGIGISEDNKRKLFKAFEKIELGERVTLNSQGVGLGLVISNNLVLMLGPPNQNTGIEVESEENIGSTFSFCIIDQQELKEEEEMASFARSEDLCSRMEENPFHTEGEERLETISNLIPQRTIDSVLLARKTLGSDLSQQASFFRHTTLAINAKVPQILVVDDDVFNISAMALVLEKLGYTCDKAYNGKQAIQKIVEKQHREQIISSKVKQYRLIFMDCNMPVMDGFEASSILKKKMKAGEIESIPIIACTAFLNEKEKEQVSSLGIDAYCLKPLDRAKISALLKRFVTNGI